MVIDATSMNNSIYFPANDRAGRPTHIASRPVIAALCSGVAGLRAALSAWPRRNVRLLAALAAAVLLPAGPAEAADQPPVGRYRCYQPPRYSVVSWFDLEADGTYRAQGGAPVRYRYEPKGRKVVWLGGDHAERGWLGLYLPPASDGAGGIRHTIVMSSPKNLKLPANDRDPRTQCFLTTH